MARGTTLSVLRTMLKAELGDFSATNTARDAELNQLLSNKQKQLALEVEWAFLQRRWDATVAAGAQFTTFPTTEIDFNTVCSMDLNRVKLVEVRFDEIWQPVLYGIGEAEYNTYDFENDSTAKVDPIQKWRIATNTADQTANKFEVWPVPLTEQTVRFTGARVVNPLLNDNSKADLDDMLLVLGVAADKLFRTKQADAQLKMAQFQRLLAQLRVKNMSTFARRTMCGPMDEDTIKIVGIRVVA